MPYDGVNLGYLLDAELFAIIGWTLLIGPPAVWLVGQLGLSRKARRMGFYTPLLTAFLGFLILDKLNRWPF